MERVRHTRSGRRRELCLRWDAQTLCNRLVRDEHDGMVNSSVSLLHAFQSTQGVSVQVGNASRSTRRHRLVLARVSGFLIATMMAFPFVTARLTAAPPA